MVVDKRHPTFLNARAENSNFQTMTFTCRQRENAAHLRRRQAMNDVRQGQRFQVATYRLVTFVHPADVPPVDDGVEFDDAAGANEDVTESVVEV